MSTRRLVSLLLTMSALAVAPRMAEAGDGFGLVMGYPTAVGVLWQATDRFALRPEFTIAHNSSDLTITLPTLAGGTSTSIDTTDTTVLGIAISALFEVARYDAVRTYISPRFEYEHRSVGGTLTIGTEALSEYAGGAAVGVQYNPALHFGVFGEIGAMYSHDSLKLGTGNSARSFIGTRGRLGVILFF
jgi:hypothetical protein